MTQRGPENPKKLIYIINHMDWFWSHRLPLALAAKDAGWDVTIAATGAGSDKKLKAYGFHAVELPSPDQGFLPSTVLKTIYKIYGQLRRQEPTLVHAITLKYAFITGLAARLFPRIQVVYTIAGLGYLFSGEGMKPKILRAAVGPLLKFALNHPHAKVIFQNPDDQTLMIRRGFVKQECTYLIRGSGVDTEIFKPTDERPEQPPVVVMPTRLVHDKGVAVFVAAARILKKQGLEGVRFQIAGGITKNNPLAICEEEMKDMVADGTVEWLGKVLDMPGLLAKCTLVAYPSWYREGVPKVLLEAAATGKAMITTDHPGCREAVAHGGNGLLVPIKDAQKLAEAIRTLLEDDAMRGRMEKASRKKAMEEFDVRFIVRKTLALYNA